MILRPEPGPISDFQDYTLVAVIAVATHLSSPHTGDHHHFLAALAQRFSQDLTALHQVCPLQQAGLSGERLSCNMPVLTARITDQTMTALMMRMLRVPTAGLSPLQTWGFS